MPAPVPTIRPYPKFNAKDDAEKLRNAMKGAGCDKPLVVDIICGRSNSQRQLIAAAYKSQFNRELNKDLESELKGDLEDTILALMEAPTRYLAKAMHDAMKGIGTKESTLIDVMCTRTNSEIKLINWYYKKMFNKKLEDDLKSETSGAFQRLLVSLCSATRDETTAVDLEKAKEDAHALHRAGERRKGTDEECFHVILTKQNYSQLRRVFDEYEKVAGHPLEKAIKSEFNGDIRNAYLAVVGAIRNPAAYFAERLYESMKGMGTRDKDLIFVLVSRSEVDLGDIREEYEKLYKKTLEKTVVGDTSGDYKDALVALVRGNKDA